MRRLNLAAASVLALFAQQPAAAADDRGWLPLKKTDVVRLLAQDADIAAVHVETFAQAIAKARDLNTKRARELEAQQSELTNAVGPDDQVWVATNTVLDFGIVMAGRDEDIHSLRMMVVTLDQRTIDRVFAIVMAIFKAVYPTWIEAEQWPIRSLQQAWDLHPLNDKRPPLQDANDVIVKRSIGAITSATFGVPPDLVVYVITARSQCVPFVDRGNPLEQHNPLARMIC
jgi:hypothetical protein